MEQTSLNLDRQLQSDHIDETKQRPRVVFLGMPGSMSFGALLRLIEGDVEIVAIVVEAVPVVPPGQQVPVRQVRPMASISTLPIMNPQVNASIVTLGWARQIPVWEIADLGADMTTLLFAQWQPDLVVVACFAHRIPTRLFALARFGWLNLHPSKLPTHRGPAPLFWALRNGDEQTGITVHYMDQGLDTGPIVLQTVFALPDGITEAEADHLFGETGGRLLVQAVQGLVAGTLHGAAQPAGGTTETRPQPADFRIDTTWTARRAFNFMRGTATWGQPYPITVAERQLLLRSTSQFEPDRQLDAAFQTDGHTWVIQFNGGVLHAQGTELPRSASDIVK